MRIKCIQCGEIGNANEFMVIITKTRKGFHISCPERISTAELEANGVIF